MSFVLLIYRKYIKNFIYCDDRHSVAYINHLYWHHKNNGFDEFILHIQGNRKVGDFIPAPPIQHQPDGFLYSGAFLSAPLLVCISNSLKIEAPFVRSFSSFSIEEIDQEILISILKELEKRGVKGFSKK